MYIQARMPTTSQWIAFGISEVAMLFIFSRRVLVQNRFCWHPPLSQWAALLGSFASGAMFWVSLLAVRRSAAEQITSGALGITLHWAVLVLVVNDAFRFPSRQQWTSLLFYYLTEGLFMVQTRLILSSD